MKTSLFAYFIKFRRAIAAVSAGLALLMAISALAGGASGQTEVVVATHDIGPGTRLESGDLTRSAINIKLPWKGLFTNERQVSGRTTSHAISSGQPLSSSDIVSTHLLKGLRPGTVAVEIGATQIANSSLLEAGHHIDLYSTSTDTRPHTALIAHDVVVLAQGSQDESGVHQTGLGITSHTGALMVAVSPGQAKKIAAKLGTNQLVAVLLNY